MTTKTLNYYLIVDWKDETVRSRKTAPDDLGPFELCIDSEIEIDIPDVDTPSISERLDVPQATVDRIALEEVFDREMPDFAESVEEVFEEGTPEAMSNHEVLGRVMERTGGAPDPEKVLNFINQNRERIE